MSASTAISPLLFIYFLNFHWDAWKIATPCRDDQKARLHLDTTTSHLASKGSPNWMDRLKNMAGMLDTGQCSHSIIFSPMIAHKCFGPLHLALQMMEVLVCIPLAFSRLSKIAFWESLTPLIKSHNLLVKAEVLSAWKEPSWGYNCETVWCSWNASSQDGAEGLLVSLCVLFLLKVAFYAENCQTPWHS